MSGSSSPIRVRRRPAGGVRRWILLGAVMVGLLAVQFLGGHDAAGHHRLPTPPAATAVQAQAEPAAMPIWSPSVDESPGNGHAHLAGCFVLLLTVTVVALGQSLRRRTSERRPPASSVPASGLRAPPLSLRRQALCVERI